MTFYINVYEQDYYTYRDGVAEKKKKQFVGGNQWKSREAADAYTVDMSKDNWIRRVYCIKVTPKAKKPEPWSYDKWAVATMKRDKTADDDGKITFGGYFSMVGK